MDCVSSVETVSVIEPSCHARGLHGHSAVCGGDPNSERMPAFCRASSRTYELGILTVRFHDATGLVLRPAGPTGGEQLHSPTTEELGRTLEVHCDYNAGLTDPKNGQPLPPAPVRFRALPTAASVASTAAPVKVSQVQDNAYEPQDAQHDEAFSQSADDLASRACASGMCCLGTKDWHGGPVFLLTGAYPHNETSPALFANSISQHHKGSANARTLTLTLILSASTLTHSQTFLPARALGSCRVLALPPSQQTAFPPLQLLTQHSRVILASKPRRTYTRPVPALLRCESHADAREPDEDYVADLVEEHNVIIGAPLPDDLNPDAEPESPRAMQAIPGSVSFLQVDAFQKFVATSVKATMNPMLHILQDMTSLDTATTMTNQIMAAVLERTPKQVIFLTRDPIRRNITNQVVDATAIVLNRILHKSIPLTLSPYIADHVTKWTPPMVLKHLEPVLEDALTYDLVRIIPPILNRALPLSLEYSLNRALTHAVVPAVSSALSRSTAAGHYCYLCYYHNKACFLCNASPESQYYLAYYSTYFSDYYSDYYTPYYFTAINKVVNRNNPDVLTESAGFLDKKGNIWPKSQ